MAKLLVSTAGAAVLWAGGIAINAGLARFSNERIAAKRARTLAKLRIDFDLLLAERLSVLMAGKGEAADWSNEALQAIWASVISPIVAVQAPPLVDLVLHQLVTAPHLLPPWVSSLKLVAVDLGTRAPKLTRVALAAANDNGTLPPGDVLVDFEVDLDLDCKIDILATLDTGFSRLVSRLTHRAHASTVNLHISRIRQGLVLRVRFRPGAAAVFVGLLRFTSPPSSELTLTAVDVSGMRISLPMHHFPGHDTITAWVVQKLMRDLMALPHRFVPLDLSPLLEALETRDGLDLSAVPMGGSLRLQVMEAVGLSSSTAGSSRPAELKRGGSSLEGAAQFDTGCGDTDSGPSDGGRQSVDAKQSGSPGRSGPHAYAYVEYAFGARNARTSASGEGADAAGRVAWAAHEGTLVLDLVGPVDAITITLRRRGVPGPAGRLAQAHLKVYWAPDGSTSVFYADAAGLPVIVKAAVASARDGGRQAAGVVFSGKTGAAEAWIPLQHAAGGEAAAVRVALSAEWFGARGTASSAQRLSPAEVAAAMVMQRFVRRWKARRTAARERALMAPLRPGGQPLFTPQLQLCVTMQRARGLPLKTGYRCALTIMPGNNAPPGPGAAMLTAASRMPVSSPASIEASTEPRFGQSLRVDAPAGGVAQLWAASPTLRVTLFRKDAVLAMGYLTIPAEHPQQRGSAVPVWMRLGGSGLTELANKAVVRLRKGGAPPAETHEPPAGVLLYLSVVPKSAHEGPLISEQAVQQAMAVLNAKAKAKPPPAGAKAPAAAAAAAPAAAAVAQEAAAEVEPLAPAAGDESEAVEEAAAAEPHAAAADAAADVQATRAAAAAAAAEAAAAHAEAEAAEREAEAALAAALAEAHAEAAAELAAAAPPPEPVAVDPKAAAAAKKAADAAAKAQAEAEKRAAEQARKAAEAEAKAKAAADKAAAEQARKAAEAEKKAAEAEAKQRAAEEKRVAEEARKAAEAEAKAKAAADKAAEEEAKKAAAAAAAAAEAESARAAEAAAAAPQPAPVEAEAAPEAAPETQAAHEAAAPEVKSAAEDAAVSAAASEPAHAVPEPVAAPEAEAEPEQEASAEHAATAPEPEITAAEPEAAPEAAPASEAAAEAQAAPEPEPEVAPEPVDPKKAAAAKKAAEAAAKAQAEAEKRAGMARALAALKRAEEQRKVDAAAAKAKAAADKAAAEEAKKAAAAEKKAADAAAKQRAIDDKRAAEEARKVAEAEAKVKAAAEAEQYKQRKAQAHTAASLSSPASSPAPKPKPAASPPAMEHAHGHYEDSDEEDAAPVASPPASPAVVSVSHLRVATQASPAASPPPPAHAAGHYEDSDVGSPNTGDYLHTIVEQEEAAVSPPPASPAPAPRAFGSPLEAPSPTPVPSPGSTMSAAATPETTPQRPAKPVAPQPWPAPPARAAGDD